MMSDTIDMLIDDFMQAAYDTGWNAGHGLAPFREAGLEMRRRAKAALVKYVLDSDRRADTYRDRALALVQQCSVLRQEIFRLTAALYQAKAERERASQRAIVAEFRLAQLQAKQS